jgi:hypothetical protein
MKSTTFTAFLIILLVPVAPAAADTEATALDTLFVDIWPDYDKASVLIMLTGTLPKASPLPARVTLPLPASAQVNAVARIDSRDGVMRDDILSSPSLDALTLITPDPAFRVEYYLPYTEKEKRRIFDFHWQAGLSVAKFRLKVQQPAAATSFRTNPTTFDIVRDENGLNYHSFPVQSVPAGQPYRLQLSYEMDPPRLSVQALPPPQPAPAPAAPPSRTAIDRGTPWPLVVVFAGVVLVVLAVIWMVASRRSGAAVDRRR